MGRYLYGVSVKKGALALNGRVHLADDGGEHDANDDPLVDDEADRDGDHRVGVDEVHGAVDGVDDPCRLVAELFDHPGGRCRLLADELVARKGVSEK